MPTKIRSQRLLMRKLNYMEACGEAKEWIEEEQFTTWKQIWDNCERGDWLMWLLIRISVPEPYGTYAVSALEQGFGESLYSNCWGKFLIDVIKFGSGYHDACVSHIISDKISDYVWSNYSDSYILRNYHENRLHKECCNRIRKVVPFVILRDALNGWCKENYF